MQRTNGSGNRPSAQPSSSERRYDVIVVGAGPTGLTAANVLAQAGHKVAIFERHPAAYNLPRAGHIDNECLRILQGIGCLEALMEDAYPILRVPLLDGQGKFLMELVPAHQTVSSFPSVMMYQPVLEDALYKGLKRNDAFVTLYQGWTVDGLVNQDATSAYVSAHSTERNGISNRTAENCSVIFECRYVIAADGAASSIRQSAGIDREDFGFNERWLDVDMAYRRPCDFGPPAVVGDPRRPHFFSPLGKQHHRFECQLFPHESTADFSAPETAWAFLAEKGVTGDDVEIVRQAVYTFEYRLAQRWREGRIFLIGDAAHTMYPLLGQGMSSGMRDAANLGWKLDLVLRGLANAEILESYEVERLPHVKTWADLSRVAGDFICLTDPDAAADRDARVRNGGAPAWRPPPKLTTGLFDFSPDNPTNVAGDLIPQRTIRREGRVGLFDDITGRAFLLLARDDPRPFLSRQDENFMQHIGMGHARVSGNADGAFALGDETGEYVSFFEKNGLEAIIVRPDRYVFGGVPKLDELGSLMAKLKHKLKVPIL
jgi:3-(3-hydroxy-phenyl)propionate hydroxylase